MIEIEQRYKINDAKQITGILAGHGIEQTNKSHIIDEWFDDEHGLAYRVRRIEQADGSWAVKVETKQLTEAGDHNTFDEKEIDITDYDKAHAFLVEKDYWNWLTIDKTRIQFDSHDPEIDIVLDEIGGLAEKIGVGAALEIEYQGEKDRDGALEKLGAFAASLGLSPDQLFTKSLTVEAMTELAKFDEMS